IPTRPAGDVEADQLYLASFARRDELLRFLQSKGVEVKIHYPIPLHLQPAAAGLGYTKGDFPVSERQAEEIMTVPAHQYITTEQIGYMLDEIAHFYGRKDCSGFQKTSVVKPSRPLSRLQHPVDA